MLLLLIICGVLLPLSLVEGYKRPCGFYYHRWYKDMRWCGHRGSRLYVGDFNGDGRVDMLCYDTVGNSWVSLAAVAGTFKTTSHYRRIVKCGKPVLIGDVNGDHRDDIICHDHRGIAWVAYTDYKGAIGTIQTVNNKWCVGTSLHVFVGYFNKDKTADLLCHNSATGFKRILYSSERRGFAGKCWKYPLGWCNHKTSRLNVGDFNGDGQTDILCTDNGGRIWVNLAQTDGTFYGPGKLFQLKFCVGKKELHIGDFNADKRSDLLCHGRDNGDKRIAYATPAGGFGAGKGQQWYALNTLRGWCAHGSATLYVGDFNNDRLDDILCHQVPSGKKWTIYGECY